MPTAPSSPPDGPVTLAIVNARVWTGDAARPWADALAIRGHHLAMVGSSAEVRKLAPPTARVINAMGALVKGGVVEGDATAGRAGADDTVAESTILRRGMPANVLMLDGGPSTPVPEVLSEPRVCLQIVAGRVVYEAP